MSQDDIRRRLFILWWLFMLRWLVPCVIFVIVWGGLCLVGYEEENAYFLYLGWVPAFALGWVADFFGRKIIKARLNRLELEEGDEMQG